MAASTPSQHERNGSASPGNASTFTNAVPPNSDGVPRSDGAHTGPVGNASIPELIGRLINNLSALVDKQIELAKQEIREDIGEVLNAIKTLAIGAGLAAAGGMLLLITAWTGLIWFFNWVGWHLLGADWIGWLVGFLLPLGVLFLAWSRFVKRGIEQVKIKPLERTRATLKEDMEWFRQLRTPSAK